LKNLVPRTVMAALMCASLTVGTLGAAQSSDALANPADGDWLHARRTFSGWGHSPLSQIDASNVGGLALAWAVAMEPGNNQTTPIVYDGTMYLAHPNDIIQALDPTTGDLIWEYRRDNPDFEGRGGITGLSNIVRNMALYDGVIYHASADAAVIAIDASNGQVIWESTVGDWMDIGHSAGPMVVDGKVITGRNCEYGFPGGCFIAAHDSVDGEELWRTYLIPRPGEPNGDTWGVLPAESRVHVGAWGQVGAFDPDLNLLYWGTSVPAPSPEVLRGTVGDDVLYSNSTLAIDADTGEIVWYYQHLPRDNWDFDHPFERMIMDTAVAPNADEVEWINPNIVPGQVYRTMTGIPGKTGIVYSLDRATGEFLWARTTVQQNVVSEILDDGRVVVNEDVIPTSIDDPYGLVCPTPLGGKDWMPGAYSPDTNAMYMPLANMCFEPEITTDEWTPADGYAITISPFLTPGEENVGTLQAISAETGSLLWKVEQPAMFMPVLSTGGNLVFVGDTQRRFHAFNASTGESLWTTIVGGPASGHPISYEVDGVQYVAIATGGGFIEGFYNTAAGLSAQTTNNQLYVFRLP